VRELRFLKLRCGKNPTKGGEVLARFSGGRVVVAFLSRGGFHKGTFEIIYPL